MSERTTCVNHPKVETYLRCNRCSDPICPKCAVRTEVGYRCRNCINRQQKVFYEDFRPIYYLVAVLVALPLSLVAGLIIPNLGWFTIFLGPVAGMAITEATRWAIGKRRGRYVWLIVCGSIVLGALPGLIFSLLTLISFSGALTSGGEGMMYLLMGSGMSIFWNVAYLITAVGSAYARLRSKRRR